MPFHGKEICMRWLAEKEGVTEVVGVESDAEVIKQFFENHHIPYAVRMAKGRDGCAVFGYHSTDRSKNITIYKILIVNKKIERS